MALILTLDLALIFFPGNKIETYYGGLGSYGSLYGGLGSYGGMYGAFSSYGGMYGGYGPISTLGGIIYAPTYEGYGGYGGYELGYYDSEPGFIGIIPILPSEPEILFPNFSFIQNSQSAGPLNIFPAFMPSFDTAPITYPLYPLGSKLPWFDLQSELLSTFVFPKTAAFPPNPYQPDVYSTVPYPTPPGNILLPW